MSESVQLMHLIAGIVTSGKVNYPAFVFNLLTSVKEYTIGLTLDLLLLLWEKHYVRPSYLYPSSFSTPQ